jgi:hypothetical protein
MQHRVKLVSMASVSLLAAATLLGATSGASAAEGCFEKPGREVDPGHWYYRTDRLHNRRCWFFEPSEATVTPSASTDRAPAPNANHDEAWYNRFATGVAQTLSPQQKQNSIASPSAETSQNNISAYSSEPPKNGILNTSGSVTKSASPKRSTTPKIVRQDQPALTPPPATTGLASTERRNQTPPQSTAEKDDKQARQLTDAERQSLFEDFLKWYRDRGVYGQP